MKKEFEILLIGYYGFGNLGDELLAEASIKLLVKCGVRPEKIAMLSAGPQESEKKFGVRAFNRWKPSEVIKACRRSGALLLGGGGLFQDATSARSCVYYWGVTLIAKLCGMKIFAAGQSVGPLRGGMSRVFAKHALSMCSEISLRDETSMKLVKGFGLDARMTPDLVLTLGLPAKSRGGGAMLFNARPSYGALAEESAKKCAVIARERKCEVVGVALADEDVSEMKRLEVLDYIKFRDIITVRSLEDFSRVAEGASAAIGMRLHFLELCALAALPAAGCPYDPKVSDFCMRYNIATTNDGLEAPRLDVAAIPAEEGEEALKNFREALFLIIGNTDGRKEICKAE